MGAPGGTRTHDLSRHTPALYLVTNWDIPRLCCSFGNAKVGEAKVSEAKFGEAKVGEAKRRLTIFFFFFFFFFLVGLCRRLAKRKFTRTFSKKQKIGEQNNLIMGNKYGQTIIF